MSVGTKWVGTKWSGRIMRVIRYLVLLVGTMTPANRKKKDEPDRRQNGCPEQFPEAESPQWILLGTGGTCPPAYSRKRHQPEHDDARADGVSDKYILCRSFRSHNVVESGVTDRPSDGAILFIPLRRTDGINRATFRTTPSAV